MRKAIGSDDIDQLAAVLAAIEAANKVASVDLGKLAQEIEAKKTPRELLADQLERNVPKNMDGSVRNSKKAKGKRADGKKRVSPLKKHWKTRRKIDKIRKDRENARRLWRRKARGIEWLRDGSAEGLWNYLTQQGKWSRAAWRPLWKISKKDFMEHIYPHVSHCVPFIYRYDTSKPVTMRNCMWKDGATVLFDGAEWWLARNGGEKAVKELACGEEFAQIDNSLGMFEEGRAVSVEQNWNEINRLEKREK